MVETPSPLWFDYLAARLVSRPQHQGVATQSLSEYCVNPFALPIGRGLAKYQHFQML